MKTIHDILKELRACNEAVKWAKKYDTIEEMVANVQRGDWLLWLGVKLRLPVKEMTLAKARCAKTVVHLMKDERSRKAVEVAESFGLGKATRSELNSAYDYAYNAYDEAYDDAYDDAAANAAAHASNAAVAYASAAYAAYTVDYTAYTVAYTADDASASDAAAHPSDAAADSAYNAAYNAACASDDSAENKKLTADICREVLAELIIKKVNEKQKS